MTNKLPFKDTFAESFRLGFKNFLPVLGVIVLYILTIWIPYINIGTTIAVEALPLKLAKGEKIKPLYIFESKYRKLMGDYLILLVIEMLCLIAAMCFLFIPMYVLAMAWSLATLLFIDKGIAPLDALRKSNELTYGYKWRMFWISMVWGLVLGVIIAIIAILFIAVYKNYVLYGVFYAIAVLLFIPVAVAMEAIFYRELTNEEEPVDEEPKTEVIMEEVIVTEEVKE